MSWREKLWPFSKRPTVPDAVRKVNFTMAGWAEQEPNGNLRGWLRPNGSILSLGDMGSHAWFSASETELRDLARQLAADREGGLIEVTRLRCGRNPAVRLIYKRLQAPAYVFTGMFMTPMGGAPLVWTIVDGERGVTGVREAVIGAEMWGSGQTKNIEDYERIWPQDPYDMLSLGVDRSVQRFISDNEEYDSRFPDHPLTGVRRFLDDLCIWIQSDSHTPDQNETIQ